MPYKYDGRSFGQRHPVLATIAIVTFAIVGLVPGIAMLSKPVACAVGATEIWCPEPIDE